MATLTSLKSVIQSQEGKIAAFIYEPLLQGAGGMKMYGSGNMNGLLEFVQKQNILCIADEVLTGFGRTGPLFASEQIAHPPDIICLSKGLTGGTMALGVTACSQTIFDAFLSDDRSKTFFHGHSYTANPLACAAGLASLDLLEEKTCRDQIESIQRQHQSFVKNELSVVRHDLFENIRTLGTILAFEFKSGKNEYSNQAGRAILKEAMSAGIYLRPLGNTVYVLPPYCITANQLRAIYDFILSIPERVRLKA